MVRPASTSPTAGRVVAAVAATFILSACVPDIPEFSPDGRTLAFTLDDSLALIDTRTKAVRVLPDSTSGWWPSCAGRTVYRLLRPARRAGQAL